MVAVWALVVQTSSRGADAGFWFDPVAYEAPPPLGVLTDEDLVTVESVARAELSRAFAGLAIELTDRRDAWFRLRVAAELHDVRLRRHWEVAGASRAVAGFGGAGAVSFRFLAASAVGFAPPDASRDTLLKAIGTGIGRAAAHELAHQLLPAAPLHTSRDVRSYEYASAARREQYYGAMHWSFARPLLERRLARD